MDAEMPIDRPKIRKHGDIKIMQVELDIIAVSNGLVNLSPECYFIYRKKDGH